MERGELSDAEWVVLGPLLPSERTKGRPAFDNRRVLNGIFWVIRTGAPWRDLPERYGRWHSVYTRFARWSRAGVFNRVLTRLGHIDDQASLIQLLDGTVVRAHQHAAGAKGGQQDQALGRSRGGFSTKIHLRCDLMGRLLGFSLTAGQAGEKAEALPLLDRPGPRPAAVIADKGYDSDAIRAGLAERGVAAVIPCLRIGRRDIPHDRSLYRSRNIVERLVSRLKQARRLATRYDKTVASFAGYIALVAIRLIINFVNRA